MAKGVHNFSNQQITKLLRSVAAAISLKHGNIFQARAYETAADSIEHSTTEVKDLWEEDRLSEVPGIGANLKQHLDELFKTGQVRHFNSLMKKIEPVVFDLLDIPGVGPKTAFEIAKLGVKDLANSKEQIKSGMLAKKGFSSKIAEKIMMGLEEVSGRAGRMLLPYAAAQAQRILEYLKKAPGISAVDPLGSLRRQVATIGDIDFAASSNEPKKVVDYFVQMPGVVEVADHGTNKATVVLASGLHIDLLVGQPDSYGALLQHFTGSKQHNIKLRTLAEKRGLSLSEYGVRRVGQESRIKNQGKKRDNLIPCKTEDQLYEILGMQTPPPEIREDNGEIEAALAHQLPNLIEIGDIKGDLHTHSNYPIINPSHGPGADSIEEVVKKAKQLGYQFIGISDHPPGHASASAQQISDWAQKRTKYIQSLKNLPAGRQGTKSIRVLNGLEVDILNDGSLSVPNQTLQTLDYCIAGIHSGHRAGKEVITRRLMKALENPHVDILSHPTNRLLNERESSDADWEKIFKFCAKNHKLLEINGYPNRLDLRDDLVRTALQFGVKFVINTDAHAIDQMGNMPYGCSVARRGWVTKEDVVNSWDWTRFAKWFKIQ